MGKLSDQIRVLIRDGRYVVGEHAVEQLEVRGILEWQILAEMEDARLLTERPNAKPNAAVEFQLQLADGIDVKAVWSWLRGINVAKLVTVHFFDRD